MFGYRSVHSRICSEAAHKIEGSGGTDAYYLQLSQGTQINPLDFDGTQGRTIIQRHWLCHQGFS
jgi:hypothetical protein